MADENQLVFIERTGHTYQQKEQDIADKILQVVIEWRDSEGLSEKKQAFERLEKMIRPIPDLDEEKELAEYREERYGV